MTTVYICIPTTKERKDRLQRCIESIHENAGVSHVIVTYENYREGFVKPIHLILDGLKDDTLVWCIGDDTILTEKDTLKRLVEVFEEGMSDCVIQPDDGIQHGAIITMPLCTAKTMRDGTHKGYFLNFADNEFTEVMAIKKKYVYCPDIKVDHQHWMVKKAPIDETYAFAQTKFAEDRELFIARKKERETKKRNIQYFENDKTAGWVCDCGYASTVKELADNHKCK